MRILLALVVGIFVGAYGMYLYRQPAAGIQVSDTASPSARETADRAVGKTRAVASDVSEKLSARMQEWHLTGPEIRADLEKSGKVVRENTARFREKVADARIIAVIKAKYVLDRDLSASAVSVESIDGNVTLSGVLAAETLVARSVALALDTDGVRHVTSRITVGTK